MTTTLLSPVSLGKTAGADEGLAFWKEVLPETSIDYDGSHIDFNQQYFADLKAAFQAKALDQVPFMLADANNAHTMDPERQRGVVTELATTDELPPEVRGASGGKPGLWAKVRFPSRKAAEAVLSNPALGVSARIRSGMHRADGKEFPRALIHVLGTLDPRVTGMSPWVETKLSVNAGDGELLDLSTKVFSEGEEVAEDELTEEVEDVETPEEGATDDTAEDAGLEALAKWLEENEVELVDEDDKVTEPEEVREPELVGLSNEVQGQIDLANARATEALTKLAAAEWNAKRAEYLAAGVPPFMLDLATPLMSKPHETVDLANGEDSAETIVAAILEGAKGTVDLSAETGYGDEDMAGGDSEILARWAAEAGN